MRLFRDFFLFNRRKSTRFFRDPPKRMRKLNLDTRFWGALYIPEEYVRRGMTDKPFLEALSFALCLKLKFRSSTLLNPTIESIKHHFHCGTNKAMRVLHKALEEGLVVERNGHLIAVDLKIYDEKTLYLRVERETYTFSKGISKEIRLTETERQLRKLMMANLMGKKADVVDKYTKAIGRKACNAKEYKQARRALEHMQLRPQKDPRGLSKSRLANEVSICRTTAFKYCKQMERDGVISQKQHIEMANIKRDKLPNGAVNGMFRTEDGEFFFTSKNGNVFKQYANIFTLHKETHRLVKISSYAKENRKHERRVRKSLRASIAKIG